MSKDFEELAEYIQRLNARYVETLWLFHLFVKFNKLKAPNVVGESTARENVVTINRFPAVFVTCVEALSFRLIIELAKFFDTEPDSLFLFKLISFVQNRNSEITREDFLAFHGKGSIPENIALFDGVGSDQLRSLKTKIKQSKPIWEKVKKIRNQSLAHDDLVKDIASITFDEIEEIINLLGEILELFSGAYLMSYTMYSKPLKDVNDDVDYLFTVLNKAERDRIVSLG